MHRDGPLRGGHRTVPIRRGNHVVKPPGSWSHASFELLQYLQQRGYRASPRPIGISASGDEILAYIDGEAASGAPLPAHVWNDDTLRTAVELLRQLHDLTRGWRPQHADWRAPPGAPHGDVVCHNDAAPWNAVFRGGRLVAFVDWDAAGPGTALWELGYVAWHWVPMWPDGRALEHGFVQLDQRKRRLATIAESYGGVRAAAILEAAAARQIAWQHELSAGAAAGVASYKALIDAGSAEGVLADMDFVQRHRRDLL